MKNIRKLAKKREKGAVALTTLIVVSAILMLTGITILLVNIDLSRATTSSNATIMNRMRLTACLEESLIRLKDNDIFIGTITMNFNSYTCESIVTDNGSPGVKNISITSSSHEFNYQKDFQVDITTDPMTLL